MATRARGFSDKAGPFIKRNPGLPAHDIVRQLLASGLVRSEAQDPVGSLVATLHKHRRQIGVERRKEGGVYRYYPKNGHTSVGEEVIVSPQDSVITAPDEVVLLMVKLPASLLDVIDVLVATNQCKDRGAAVAWLVERGISSMRLSR